MPSIKNPIAGFALFALTCNAFVPTTKPPMAAVNKMLVFHNPTNALAPSSGGLRTMTALSMVNNNNGNLLDRFARVVKSNINKFVGSIENPEKVILQAVDDMQVRYAVVVACDARVVD
jgi:hypothetical protein